MRILHVIETLGRGGAEQALVNLLPALNERGITNEVAFLWGADALTSNLESAGVTVHPLAVSARWSPLEAREKLREVLKRRSIKLVISHLYFGHLHAAWATHRQPQIQVFHNQTYDSFRPSSLKDRVRLKLHRLAAQRADAHVAVSAAAGRSASNHLHIPFPDIIPNALPLETLRPVIGLDTATVRAESCVPSDALLVICASRLVQEKGLETLLEAFSKLYQSSRDTHLLIVGDGPLRPQLTCLRERLGLNEAVTLHGAIPHDRLMRWIQSAEILVLPSHFEGLGLALAEGMALERPVIGTLETGMADLIEHRVSGILVPRGDPDALASALLELRNAPEVRLRLGLEARKRIHRHLRVEVVARRWEELIQRVI